MDTNKVIEITKDFYKNISKEFSDTRQYSWKGWEGILQYLDMKENCKVLDLGCGNGRFYEFLVKHIDKNINYIGVDGDEGLLSITKEKYKGARFLEGNIFENYGNTNSTYDLVVGFGITHHIPGKKFRNNWFENIYKILNRQGYLILSFWNFLDKKSLVKATDLEENDYWLGWNNKEVKRYCHYYGKKELIELDKMLLEKGISLVKEIESGADLNTYKIYQYN